VSLALANKKGKSRSALLSGGHSAYHPGVHASGAASLALLSDVRPGNRLLCAEGLGIPTARISPQGSKPVASFFIFRLLGLSLVARIDGHAGVDL